MGLRPPTGIGATASKSPTRPGPNCAANGGFGLASLKDHLKLNFRHHDGEEDARASAEIVLLAEEKTSLDFTAPSKAQLKRSTAKDPRQLELFPLSPP